MNLLLRGRLIEAEEAVASEQATKVVEAWHMATLWTWVVEVEMKADHLEAKFTHASKSQQGVSSAKRKHPRREHEPLATRKV